MTFEDMGLAPRLVEHLKTKGFKTPTPIQAKAIPHALKGRDVLGLAQTGTGKTASFGLPLLHVISGSGAAPQPKSATSLILAPTRELAKQIAEALVTFSHVSHLKVALVGWCFNQPPD